MVKMGIQLILLNWEESILRNQPKRPVGFWSMTIYPQHIVYDLMTEIVFMN